MGVVGALVNVIVNWLVQSANFHRPGHSLIRGNEQANSSDSGCIMFPSWMC